MGWPTGFKQCGSLLLARTRDRLTHLRRMKAHSTCRKIDCHMLSNDEIARRYPYINISDLHGGLFLPDDGVADPDAICTSLASLASQRGVRLYEHIHVHRVLTNQNRVAAVETDRGNNQRLQMIKLDLIFYFDYFKGTIRCDYFVNCAGFWARSLGKKTQPMVKVPVQAVEHYYLHTKPSNDSEHPAADPEMPVIRDLDGHIYIREKDGRFLAGGFEPLAKPVFEDGSLPVSVDESQLEVDWDHFAPMLQQMVHRMPSLGEQVLDKLCNGPEAFSPDCKWVLGESSEVDNYFVATGMKSLGIASAGGVAKYLSDWMVGGRPAWPLNELDSCRYTTTVNFFLNGCVKYPASTTNCPTH